MFNEVECLKKVSDAVPLRIAIGLIQDARARHGASPKEAWQRGCKSLSYYDGPAPAGRGGVDLGRNQTHTVARVAG